MSCILTYKGKEFTDDQWKDELKDKEFADMFRAGKVYKDHVGIDGKTFQLQTDDRGRITDDKLKEVPEKNDDTFGNAPFNRGLNALDQKRWEPFVAG